MDAQHLRLFVEVTRKGGFAAVARDAEVDPSYVSRSIAALENELGVRLFQRTTRKLSLTEAGHLYLARVAPLVDELEHARDEALAISRGASGTLRMTTSFSFGLQALTPLLPEFRARHPQLKVELLMTDANLDLVDDRIDLAVRLGGSFSGDAVVSKLMTTRYMVCASPGYLKQYGCPAQPQDLMRHACLLLSLPEFRNAWHFKNARGEVVDVQVQGDMVISNLLAHRQCATQGLGPALLSDWIAEEALAKGELVDLFPNYQVTATSFDTGVWLLYPSRNYLPHKVRVMMDFLKENFSK
jgi:DNA-binding transcriptional LysR family regulator